MTTSFTQSEMQANSNQEIPLVQADSRMNYISVSTNRKTLLKQICFVFLVIVVISLIVLFLKKNQLNSQKSPNYLINSVKGKTNLTKETLLDGTVVTKYVHTSDAGVATTKETRKGPWHYSENSTKSFQSDNATLNQFTTIFDEVFK